MLENNKEYLRRMLAYWDPWGLINNSGAPENEYDSYIPKINELIELKSEDETESKLKEIFYQEGMPTENLERAIKGILEGILYLRK